MAPNFFISRIRNSLSIADIKGMFRCKSFIKIKIFAGENGHLSQMGALFLRVFQFDFLLNFFFSNAGFARKWSGVSG